MQEDKVLRISAAALSAADAAALVATKKFDVKRSLNGSEYELTSRGWVGQFPLSAETLLRIEPKVPISNLFWMLDIAYRFNTFQFWKQISTQVETLPELFTRLAGIFALLVNDRIRRGICCDYIRGRNEMALVRGQVDVGASILSVARARKLVCEFEEYTPDIPDNQILFYALELISQLQLHDIEVTAAVQRARREMLGHVSSRRFSGSDCVGRQYNRLTEDYRPMHTLARLFIDHLGPGLKLGPHDALPFAIHLPGLFERFVAQWLKDATPPELEFAPKRNFRIESSHSVEIEVDIVCKERASGKVLAVLDTKYKAVEKPNQSDLGQLALYSLRTGTKKAFVVFPSRSARPFIAQIGGVIIKSIAFDIGATPRPDGDSFLRGLLAELS